MQSNNVKRVHTRFTKVTNIRLQIEFIYTFVEYLRNGFLFYVLKRELLLPTTLKKSSLRPLPIISVTCLLLNL